METPAKSDISSYLRYSFPKAGLDTPGTLEGSPDNEMFPET